MKLLVDTHVLIWVLSQSIRLPGPVRRLIRDPDNETLVSAVSAYEIEYKRPRSAEIQRLPPDLAYGVAAVGLGWMPLWFEHAVTAGRLPRLQGDPFDRLIAAQALVENATVITRDPAIKAYGAPVLW